jgi:hypothetical protein
MHAREPSELAEQIRKSKTTEFDSSKNEEAFRCFNAR